MASTRWQPRTEADERIVAYGHGNPDHLPMCDNCEYFTRHYILEKFPELLPRYRLIAKGHCRHGRLKDRNAFDLCEYHTEQKCAKHLDEMNDDKNSSIRQGGDPG